MSQDLIGKNKLKRLLIVVGVIIILFMVVACSGGNGDENPVDPQEPPQDETSDGTEDQGPIDIDTGIFDPNEGIGGFANAPYEEEAIHPTEVGWTRQSRFKGPENPVIDWTIELP